MSSTSLGSSDGEREVSADAGERETSILELEAWLEAPVDMADVLTTSSSRTCLKLLHLDSLPAELIVRRCRRRDRRYQPLTDDTCSVWRKATSRTSMGMRLTGQSGVKGCPSPEMTPATALRDPGVGTPSRENRLLLGGYVKSWAVRRIPPATYWLISM